MKLSFTKMQGAGNDFVVLDNRDGRISLRTAEIQRLCHRRFGIGADGIVLLEKATGPHMDARMVYHNSDGSRGEMCGNGARCFTAFAMSKGLGRKGVLRFLTDAGPMSATASGNLITVEMTPPTDFRLNSEIPLKKGTAIVHYLNTGVPHAVRFVDDISEIDIRKEGAELRRHKAFGPKGANANFAQVDSDGLVRVRTYERGVEDETLACGTGVTATAIAAHLIHEIPRPVRVQVAGGQTMEVDFRPDGESFRQVTLTGPATVVYEGTIEI